MADESNTMPKISYTGTTGRRFTRQWLEIIRIANSILEEYERQGFDLTLRGLYYKFVGGNLFPEDRRYAYKDGKWFPHKEGTKNAPPNYKWLGDIINDARLAGLVDWNHLVDRTRSIQDLTHFEDEADAVRKTVGWYHVDFWENQGIRPEVWVEKDAQVGNMVQLCQELDVPLFSCRGYTSQSAMWRAAQRLLHHQREGFRTVIIHFGDHDPSGLDMSRDIFDRLEMFMGGVEFERVALNMNQVRDQELPPDPAKVTDSRAKKYMEEFGDESWEMDALEPAFINNLISEKITELRDQATWDRDMERFRKGQKNLQEISDRFPEVRKFLRSGNNVLDALRRIMTATSNYPEDGGDTAQEEIFSLAYEALENFEA